MANNIKSEYLKERRRVRRFVRNAQKRGYTISPSMWNRVINKEIAEVTKADLSLMKSLRPKTLYQYMEWTNPLTGKVLSGEERRRQEKRQAAIKGQFTKVQRQDIYTHYPDFTTLVLGNVVGIIKNFQPPVHWSDYYKGIKKIHAGTLLNILNDAIRAEGTAAVAKRIYDYNKNTGEIDLLVEKILYKSENEEIQLAIAEFAQIIKGGALTMQESLEYTMMSEFESF